MSDLNLNLSFIHFQSLFGSCWPPQSFFSLKQFKITLINNTKMQHGGNHGRNPQKPQRWQTKADYSHQKCLPVVLTALDTSCRHSRRSPNPLIVVCRSPALMSSPHVHEYFLKQRLSSFVRWPRACQTSRGRYNPENMMANQKAKKSNYLNWTPV